MLGIKFTLAIMAFAILMLLTGCSQNESIVRKMAEIERLRQECAKCEANLPGQCSVGTFGMCNEVFK